MTLFRYAYVLEGLCLTLMASHVGALPAIITATVYALLGAWRLR